MKYQATKDFEYERRGKRRTVKLGDAAPDDLAPGQVASLLNAGWIKQAESKPATPKESTKTVTKPDAKISTRKK